MTGYILSILGIIVAGIFVDIVIPSGSINKYIKGIYSIFVIAVILSPIMKLMTKTHDFTIKYDTVQINENLLTYIYNMRAESLETNIEKSLANEGFENVDIILTFSIENYELNYNSCKINLQNLVIHKDKQHINKYDFIKNVVKQNTNLTEEEIIINEWKRKKTND